MVKPPFGAKFEPSAHTEIFVGFLNYLHYLVFLSAGAFEFRLFEYGIRRSLLYFTVNRLQPNAQKESYIIRWEKYTFLLLQSFWAFSTAA